MLQTFDQSVPVHEQRLRVLLKKPGRFHPKRHATSDHKVAAAKKRKGARNVAAAKHAKQRKLLLRERDFWNGKWLE